MGCNNSFTKVPFYIPEVKTKPLLIYYRNNNWDKSGRLTAVFSLYSYNINQWNVKF